MEKKAKGGIKPFKESWMRKIFWA